MTAIGEPFAWLEADVSGHVGYEKARATLARHGIDAETDVGMLDAAIEARGWRVELERVDSGYRGNRPRFHALATRLGPSMPASLCTVYVSAAGPTAQNVMVRVLAKVLEREVRMSAASPD